MTKTSRRAVGERVAPMVLDTLAHGQIRVPDSTWRVHLSFRRFAGCPICNLHLRTVADRLAEIDSAGLRTVAFLHSSAEAMRPFQGELPFPVVPDPEKRWFSVFAVESALLAMLHPAAMLHAARGMLSVRSHPLRGEGGHVGLPADFLIETDGTIAAVHYGAHPADGWSVDDLLALVRRR